MYVVVTIPTDFPAKNFNQILRENFYIIVSTCFFRFFEHAFDCIALYITAVSLGNGGIHAQCTCSAFDAAEIGGGSSSGIGRHLVDVVRFDQP